MNAITVVETRLQELSERIRPRLKRSGQDVYEIGVDLREAHGYLVEERRFLTWCSEQFGMSKSSAYNFMKVADVFEARYGVDVPNFGNFAPSALYLLANADEAVIAAAVAVSENGRVSRDLADALVGSEPQVVADMQRLGATDAAFVREMNRQYKRGSETYQETVVSGYIQPGEGREAVAVKDATLRDLRDLLDTKHREHQVSPIAHLPDLRGFVEYLADMDLGEANNSHAKAYKLLAHIQSEAQRLARAARSQ